MKIAVLALTAVLAIGNQAAPGQAAKTAPASSQSSAPPTEFGVPGVVPVAQLWTDFYARADETAATHEYNVAEELFPEKGVADATACRAKRDDLDRAVRRVPISFEIWYVRHACAIAMGDTERANESEQAMAALTRYAFAALPPDHGRSAIPVFQLGDAYAFALATGDEVIYDIFDLADTSNGDPLLIGLRDRQTRRERELRFDFVSPIIAVRRAREDEHFPGERFGVARNTIESMAKRKQIAAATEAQAVLDALDAGNATKMDELIRLARSGSYTAAIASTKCLLGKDSVCAQQAVDVLLPFAEKGYARPMLLLARAYGTGRGVQKDPEAAKTLLGGAAKRVGDAEAYAFYAASGWVGEKTPIDDFVFEQLSRSADSGDPYAAQVAALASFLRRTGNKSGLNQRELAWMELAERSGLPMAGRMLAADAMERKDAAKASAYLLKWADRDAGAAANLARAYEDGSMAGLPRDAALALKWRRRAGMLGDVASMRVVGDHYMYMDARTADSIQTAILWYSSGAVAGDWDAALDMADAFADKGDPDALKHALSTYRAAMADHDSPRARRGLAVLLMDGRGMDKDIVQARQLLLKDAEAGNSDSQLALAQALLRNKLGKSDPAEAWSWVRKAEAKGSRTASLWIASAMFSGSDGLPLDRKKALDAFERLATEGSVPAGNDYAWALCTGPDAAFRDPSKGLAAIVKVVKDSPTPSYLDTQAACLAATSDFQQAVDFQQRAIAGLPADRPATIKNMQARLVLYQHRQAYVQDAIKAAVAPATPAAGG